MKNFSRQAVAMLAFSWAMIGASLTAHAQSAQLAFGGLSHDSSLPMEITSDSLSIDQSSNIAEFSGGVKLGQGSLRIEAQNVRVRYGADGGNIEHVWADGEVFLSNGGEAAEAARAEYDALSGEILLSGNVVLTQGNNALSGDRLTINLDAGTAQISGNVTTIFQAKEN